MSIGKAFAVLVTGKLNDGTSAEVLEAFGLPSPDDVPNGASGDVDENGNRVRPTNQKDKNTRKFDFWYF